MGCRNSKQEVTQPKKEEKAVEGPQPSSPAKCANSGFPTHNNQPTSGPQNLKDSHRVENEDIPQLPFSTPLMPPPKL